MAPIMVHLTLAMPLECFIFLLIVYLTLYYLNVRRSRVPVVGSGLHDSVDSHSESSTDVLDFVSIIESESMSPRQIFELHQEFYAFMSEDKLSNLDNYLDRD